MSIGRVLVVEDEPDGQAVVTGLLDMFQIQAEAVDNAEDALEYLKRVMVDAVVIDLMLPGMDGLELIRNIRSNPATRNIPCVAITAYHTTRVKQDAMDMGFDGYFSKPIQQESFVDRLQQLIAG